MSKRKLPSDALALHHSSPDLIFAGLRSSSVLLEDLRVQSTTPNVVASAADGRAVIGVKRLKDSVVPWGLVVSAMDDPLLLFDVRFGKSPLIQFKGHRNSFPCSLGLTTSSDDEIVFAAGSDRRIRAWSTVTGDRIVSTHETEQTTEWDEQLNPLCVVFPFSVQFLEFREDFGLDAAVDAEVYRLTLNGRFIVRFEQRISDIPLAFKASASAHLPPDIPEEYLWIQLRKRTIRRSESRDTYEKGVRDRTAKANDGFLSSTERELYGLIPNAHSPYYQERAGSPLNPSHPGDHILVMPDRRLLEYVWRADRKGETQRLLRV
ncbi:MAG: hypothetical protein TREMPRED_004976 [Tremellales sp. Tagirdzhanova-0007]|nr:MAG: hypothetical protein TREMPRED_004976 [Tremellales sp. Tagirdzhanova-0007]